MSKQAIVTIDNTTYIIDAFKGVEGWKYLPKVTKLLLPFIFGSAGDETELDLDNIDEKGKEALASINEEKTLDILMNLLSGDNAEEIIELVPKLLSRVSKSGEVIDFDNEFSQNYLTMLKLVFEVIKLNYISSFKKLDTTDK